MMRSDWKVGLTLVDVWRSASTNSGAQCVIMDGMLLMLKLCADN